MRPSHLRDYTDADSHAVNAVALSAFEQFSRHYQDWQGFSANIKRMSSLADVGEIIVAMLDNTLIGAVAYVGPGKPKAAYFHTEWPIMRMLVVAPGARGRGVGKALAEACLARARRDGAKVFALHTSEMMAVALPMYLRMGFEFHAPTLRIHGIPYNVYIKRFDG